MQPILEYFESLFFSNRLNSSGFSAPICCASRSPRARSPDYSRMFIVEMLPEQLEKKIREYEEKNGIPEGEGQRQIREIMMDEVEREVYRMRAYYGEDDLQMPASKKSPKKRTKSFNNSSLALKSPENGGRDRNDADDGGYDPRTGHVPILNEYSTRFHSISYPEHYLLRPRLRRRGAKKGGPKKDKRRGNHQDDILLRSNDDEQEEYNAYIDSESQPSDTKRSGFDRLSPNPGSQNPG